MFDLKVSSNRIRYGQKWFYKKPERLDAFRCTEYFIVPCLHNIPGYKREEAFTKIIDLTKAPEEMVSEFKKNTKYEIKRAEKEGVEFKIESNPDVFMEFYNTFAKSKNNPDILPFLKKEYIYAIHDNLQVTKAIHQNEVLVMHSYIIDKEMKRARLLNTASLFRDEDDNQKRNLIGRANRFLHYQDMIYFKNNGFESYDMGGYACNTRDADLKRINDFKDCFGGKLIEESNYISLPLHIIRTLSLYKKTFSFK